MKINFILIPLLLQVFTTCVSGSDDMLDAAHYEHTCLKIVTARALHQAKQCHEYLNSLKRYYQSCYKHLNTLNYFEKINELALLSSIVEAKLDVIESKKAYFHCNHLYLRAQQVFYDTPQLNCLADEADSAYFSYYLEKFPEINNLKALHVHNQKEITLLSLSQDDLYKKYKKAIIPDIIPCYATLKSYRGE